MCRCVRVGVSVRVWGEGKGGREDPGRKGRGKEGERGVRGVSMCVCMYIYVWGRGREGVKEGRREV